MSQATVVIPCFRADERMAACLCAPGLVVRGRPAPVIVVDNGGNNGAMAVAASLGARVVAASRPGPAAARNMGLALAETEYVAFLDADCIAEAGWLEHLIADMDRNSCAGAGGTLRWSCGDPI